MIKVITASLPVLFFTIDTSFAATRTLIHLIEAKVVSTFETPSHEWSFRFPDPLPASIHHLIKISFSSSQDLSLIIKKEDINIYPSAKICGEEVVFDKADENLAFSEILDLDGRVRSGPRFKKDISPGGLNVYHVYLATASTQNSQLPINFNYDFSKKPRDICFMLGGGAMWGGKKFESNVMRISTRKIINAFLLFNKRSK
jgi:hypothetical protein